jgi:hypothetical protein
MSAFASFYIGPGRLALPESGLLLLRHGPRPPILTPAAAYSTDLTRAGRAAARAYGERLGRACTINQVFSSPVVRCVSTIEEIIEGAVDGSRPHPAIAPLPLLHFDQKQSGVAGLESVYFNDIGFLRVVNAPQSREYAILRDALLAGLPLPAGPGLINLACTHDVIITFLLAALLGASGATMADIPGYLEGICLVKQAGQVRLWDPHSS